MIRKITLIGVLATVLITSFGACSLDTWNTEDERSLRMVYTNWSEGVALTHLSQILLEEKLNYDVTLKLTDVASVYSELAEGKADVFADAWLPVTQKRYFEERQQDIEKLGIIYPEARTGLVVPEYSPLKTVKDLQEYPYDIIGIDAGAGVMHKARQAIEKYAPEKALRDLSEETMVKHLADSIKRRKNVVVTGWEPHWIFARYKVRFLEDPDGIFGKKENIYTIARKGLEEEHPHAARFFERMQLSEKQLNSLVNHMRQTEDPLVGIREWIKQNEYVVNSWLKDLQEQRDKVM